MIRVGIVGTGNIAALHIEAYLQFPGRCRIVGLCDIVPQKCADKKEKYGLENAQIFESHQEMLKTLEGNLDLVSVCTPPFQHREITIDCLQSGCHTVVEKPMSASLQECDAMLAAEKASGKTLACIAQNRFRDPILGLKKVLERGMIGRILHAQVDSFWWRGFHYYDLWWRGKWETEGGGCTLNHAVHHIDMLIWMMGMPEQITAVISNAAHSNAEVEDLSVAVLQYPQGALAQVTSSVIHHGEEQQLIFQGEKARVSAPWKVCAHKPGANAFPLKEHDEELEKNLSDFVKNLPPLPYTGHTGELENVLTALETGGRPAIDGHDGRNTLEVITAIYQAGSQGRPVKLPISQKDPFYTVKGILAGTPHFYEKSTAVKDFQGDITTGSAYT